MMNLFDWIGASLGFILTLLVFSYLIGDNPLFRFAIHLFIGVSAGFAAIIAVYNILLPRLVAPYFSSNRTEQLLALVPIILGALMLTKISPRFAFIGTLPMSYLVGVSAAAAIGGAVLGTLIPQVNASINIFDARSAQVFDASIGLRLVNGVIILIGTIATLAYFHFGKTRSGIQKTQFQAWLEGIGQVGQIFIAITFGFLFAGIFNAALTALIGRVTFVVEFVKSVLQFF
jgi:hypothetical protein